MTALRTAGLVLVLAVASPADVYLYEASVPPVDAGWQLFQNWCGAQEWIKDGDLYHHVELCPPWINGQMLDYFHAIEEVSTTGEWFAEWRMVTDGISEEIPAVAPASVVVWDVNALLYHFTIADDRVRFLRGSGLPTVYFDFEPGIHTFRLELYGADLDEIYLFFMDGQLLSSGVPDGPLFNPVSGNAQVNLGTAAALVPSTTIWSHVRWGELQVDGGADFTADGEVDFDDLPYFHECLTTEAGGWPGCAWTDMDFDGDVDCTDWELFLQVWTDPAEPPGMAECAVPPDFDGNGQVGAFDLAILLGSWGPCPDPPANCPADLDGSGFVNAFDLAMLLGSWG
ncbi:MAG: hypothetical protein O7D91_06075 [Planctomycetota bacterium]|nr:hypothetical protein [Planctomycetota bacterium]